MLEDWVEQWGISFDVNECLLITFRNRNGKELIRVEYTLVSYTLVAERLSERLCSIVSSTNDSLREIDSRIDMPRLPKQGIPLGIITDCRMCFNSFIIRPSRVMPIL